MNIDIQGCTRYGACLVLGQNSIMSQVLEVVDKFVEPTLPTISNLNQIPGETRRSTFCESKGKISNPCYKACHHLCYRRRGLGGLKDVFFCTLPYTDRSGPVPLYFVSSSKYTSRPSRRVHVNLKGIHTCVNASSCRLVNHHPWCSKAVFISRLGILVKLIISLP